MRKLYGMATISKQAATFLSDSLGIPDHEFRVVFGRTKIDYDQGKEDGNRRKHGFSLESAAFLLERILLPNPRPRPHFVSDGFIENGEVRHMHLTVDDTDKVVMMVTTMRADETVRVISFRRADKNEKRQFASLSLQILQAVHGHGH